MIVCCFLICEKEGQILDLIEYGPLKILALTIEHRSRYVPISQKMHYTCSILIKVL